MNSATILLREGLPFPLTDLVPTEDAESREYWRRWLAERSRRLQRELGLREAPLRVEDINGQPAVIARGIAGTLRIRAREIDVAPKHVDDLGGRWRGSLITMLERSSPRRTAYAATRRLQLERHTFIDHFAYGYGLALEAATRREPIRLYRSRREELSHLRGRLLVTQQLRSSLTRPHRLVCEVDYLDPNNPTNRLLQWAGRRLLSQIRDPLVRRFLSYQVGKLPSVSEPPQLPVPLVAAVPRQYSHYADSVELAVTYARGQTSFPGLSDIGGAGLVVGTERLFESFLERSLAAVVPVRSPGTWKVHAQLSEPFAEPEARGRRYFSRPDNVIEHDGVPILIVDAKYKRFQEATEEVSGDRPTNADLYQMCAAAVAHRCPKALLVYPRIQQPDERGTAEVLEPAESPWTIRWWRVPGVGSTPVRVGVATIDLALLGRHHGLQDFDRRFAELIDQAVG
jgi:5-methylcytosine-specific restriction enzyme subunit McrC